MTNFNVNSSLNAKIRSVLHGNKIPKLPLEAEIFICGWAWLQPRAAAKMRGYFALWSGRH